jgi:hypothetical protein
MELNFAFIANSAEVTQDGRFFVMGGGIDGFTASAVPSMLPTVAILASIRFSTGDCDRDHEFRAKLVLPNGSSAGIDLTSVLAPRIPVETPGIGPTLKVSVAIFGLVLPQFGRYRFILSVGAIPIGEVHFDVNPPLLTTEPDGDRR